jgi:ubiquilin
MADEAATSSDETQITFNVKSSNDQKYVITVPSTTTVADLKAKLATPEFADLPVERQRLIYSGRVLKDPDTLQGVKIKDGHTVHLVKGAASNARQNPANQGSSGAATGAGTPSAPAVPAMATGTGNNALAGLTGARYAGFHGLPGADMFGPDGGVSRERIPNAQGNSG